MKLVELVVDIPIDPKELNKDLEGLKVVLYNASRRLVGKYEPDVGLIAAIIDVESLDEVFRFPTDCRVYVKTKVKALSLDITPGDVLIGKVTKLEGRFITVNFGNMIYGISAVSHAGPTDGRRYVIEEEKVFILYPDGSREEYLSIGDEVRAKVIGGVSKIRGIRTLRLTMRSPRLGPIKRIIKRRGEEE